MTLTIKSRLIMLIALLLLLLGGVGLLGLSGMNSSNRTADLLYEESLQEAQQLATLNELLGDIMLELSLSSQHDPRLPVSALHDHPTRMHTDNVERIMGEIDTLWANRVDRERSARAETLAREFDQQYRELVENGIRPALPLFVRGNFDDANEIVFLEGMPPYRELLRTVQALITEEDTQASANYAAAVAQADRMRLLVIGTLVAGVILGGVLGWLLMQRIIGPLGRARHHLQQMAEGNLADNIQAGSQDEVGKMLSVLLESRDKIRDMIVDIQRAAESISTASTQITTGNTDLSQRTEEQASSLQETATSMDQVAATVKNNTEHTSQANRLAQEATQSADAGGQRAAQAMEKMREMKRSSDEISSITSLIDGIAFQTNILALNASVEAARAGEQGRGFAVVAGEVRDLAQRSADAAKRIQALIDNNGDVVRSGSELVEGVGTTMQEIVENIGRVSTLMSEVSRASDEQTLAIEQVNVAISQMDDVTQQNAALVEQTATASASLQEQAQDLADAVRFFRVDGTAGAPAAHGHRGGRGEPPLIRPPQALGHQRNDAHGSAGKAETHRLGDSSRKSTSEEDDWESF